MKELEEEVVTGESAMFVQYLVDFASSPIFIVILLCFVFGSFGGLISVWVESDDQTAGSQNGKTAASKDGGGQRLPLSNPKTAAIGTGGALGFLFFTLAVGGITESVASNFSEQLRLLSTSVIAGFGARRLLPQMAGHLEQRIAKANKDASEAKEKAEGASDLVKDLRQQLEDANKQVATMRVRTQLKHAIETPDADRVWKTALTDAKEIIEARGSTISSLWIDAARVEMRYVSIDAALETLSDMVKLVENGTLPKNNNYPTAFFNRACYYSQKYCASGEEIHCTQALDSLRKMWDAADAPEVFAKYIESDNQLDPVRKNPEFSGILDTFKNAKPG
jgi:hypothetical protein